MLKTYLRSYLRDRPFFLSLIRAKEASLYASYLPLARPVLDVGCGDGFFAKTVFGSLDVGLDLAGSRMDEARRRRVYRKLVSYDGRHMPFRANSFQTVISNCVLEHVDEVGAVVGEMYRVLRPGGEALVTVMAKPWEEHLAGSKLVGNRYKTFMRNRQVHKNLLPKSGWDNVVIRAGFEIKTSVGYLSPSACALIDLAHYLSLPSLFLYTVTRQWVLWPALTALYPISWLAKVLAEPVASTKSGALFYVLHKV